LFDIKLNFSRQAKLVSIIIEIYFNNYQTKQ